MDTKGNVTSRVISYIKNNIRNGNWKLDEKIPSENELCKELNVSRVSVRSALKQFVDLGILESIHGKGTYLKNANVIDLGTGGEEAETADCANDIIDLLAFRAMVEPEACAKVAPTASPELIARLTNDLKAMEASRDDNDSFVNNDIRFHMAICEETHNPILISIMSDIFEKKRDSCRVLRIATGYYGGVYYHSLLLDAFKLQDGKLARTLMKEHLERGITDVSLDSKIAEESH